MLDNKVRSGKINTGVKSSAVRNTVERMPVSHRHMYYEVQQFVVEAFALLFRLIASSNVQPIATRGSMLPCFAIKESHQLKYVHSDCRIVSARPY